MIFLLSRVIYFCFWKRFRDHSSFWPLRKLDELELQWSGSTKHTWLELREDQNSSLLLALFHVLVPFFVLSFVSFRTTMENIGDFISVAC
jgi:hypothetical protein